MGETDSFHMPIYQQERPALKATTSGFRRKAF
jgi:hypothetical protein